MPPTVVQSVAGTSKMTKNVNIQCKHGSRSGGTVGYMYYYIIMTWISFSKSDVLKILVSTYVDYSTSPGEYF